MQNAPREHSAILSTFIKLYIPFVFKIIVLSIFEWPLKTGFTVIAIPYDSVFHLYGVSSVDIAHYELLVFRA